MPDWLHADLLKRTDAKRSIRVPTSLGCNSLGVFSFGKELDPTTAEMVHALVNRQFGWQVRLRTRPRQPTASRQTSGSAGSETGP